MPHTYVSSLVHCVFSTKNRRRIISEEVQPALWAYLGGIARKNDFRVLAAGGTQDHVHVLLSLPATLPIAKALQLLKGGSSKWLNEGTVKNFAWQDAYGAFSIGVSQCGETKTYIQLQKEHHSKRDFESEFLAFLKKHGVEYDPQHVFG